MQLAASTFHISDEDLIEMYRLYRHVYSALVAAMRSAAPAASATSLPTLSPQALLAQDLAARVTMSLVSAAQVVQQRLPTALDGDPALRCGQLWLLATRYRELDPKFILEVGSRYLRLHK